MVQDPKTPLRDESVSLNTLGEVVVKAGNGVASGTVQALVREHDTTVRPHVWPAPVACCSFVSAVLLFVRHDCTAEL